MSTYVTYLPSTSLTLPSQAGQAGKYLYTDGTSLSWATPVTQTITSGVTATSPSENAVYSALASKVAGPAAAADLNIAIFDGVTGKLIKDSVGWSISSGNLLSTADGTYNIGAPSASRPGRVYAKTAINLDSLTINTILGSDASRNIVSLDTTVYPSLVELSYVKGVTSSIQTQLNGKQASGNYITALTSDITASGPGSAAATISNNVVTNAKLFQMVNNTIKGNVSGSTGAPSDLTGTQVTALLDTFTSSLKGLTPASGGGTTNFLRADGTWAAPASLPSYSKDKVLYSTASASEWRTVGLGSSDAAYPANTIILGQTKPTGMVNANSVIVSTNTTSITSAQYNVLIGDTASNITTGQNNTIIGMVNTGSNPPANIIESVVVGSRTNASGSQSVSVGDKAQAGLYSVSIGQTSNSNGNYSTSIGGLCGSYLTDYTVSIGYGATNRGTGYGVAVGALSGGNGGIDMGGYNTSIGAYAGRGMNNATATRNVFLGYSAGRYNTNQADELFIDNRDRTSYALQQTNALIYGKFNNTPSSQTLTFNAAVTATYGMTVSTAGYGIAIKDGGANSKIGVTGAFPGGGTNSVTVTNTGITANSVILLTAQTGAPTINPGVWISARTNGASFTISASDNSFTGTVGYVIIDLIP